MTTSTSDSAERISADLIRAEALALGFDLCRFTDIDETWPAAGRLGEFLDEGRHGEMGWMATTRERRVPPRALWTGGGKDRGLGGHYGADRGPPENLDKPTKGA